MTNNKQQKGTNFGIILYPENEDHMKTLEHVKRYAPVLEWTWFAILHDRDKFETETAEEEKKPHYHLVVIGESRRTVKSMAERLQLPPEYNFIECLNSNPRGMLRYLTHMDHPEKYQYSPKDVVGSTDYSRYLNGLSRNRNADDNRRAFMELISGYPYRPSWFTLVRDAEEIGLGKWVESHVAFVKTVLQDMDCSEPVYRSVQEMVDRKVSAEVERRKAEIDSQVEEHRKRYVVMRAEQMTFVPEGESTPFDI